MLVVSGWWDARWAPGVIRIVLDGARPARVPDAIVDEIKSCERGGLVELPRREGFKAGEQVRILAGPFEGHLGLYAGMRAHERVLVLLALLGGSNGWSCPRPTSRPCAPEGMVRLDAALAVDQRDAFLQEVADALQGCAEIGPGTVHRAIAAGAAPALGPAGSQPSQWQVSLTAPWASVQPPAAVAAAARGAESYRRPSGDGE